MTEEQLKRLEAITDRLEKITRKIVMSTACMGVLESMKAENIFALTHAMKPRYGTKDFLECLEKYGFSTDPPKEKKNVIEKPH